MAHAFNSGTWEAEADLSEFEANLVYKVSSRTARIVAQRNPVLQNKQTKRKKSIHISGILCDISTHVHSVH